MQNGALPAGTRRLKFIVAEVGDDLRDIFSRVKSRTSTKTLPAVANSTGAFHPIVGTFPGIVRLRRRSASWRT